MPDAVDQRGVFYEGRVIMESIKQYLLSITTAAILSACICAFFQKGTSAKLIRSLCGVFVSLTVLQPLVNLKLPNMELYIDSFSREANIVVEEGELIAGEAQCEVIKQQAEAYISDKAAQLACSLEVNVTLSKESPYQPIKVELKGDVSPYAKSQLTSSIEQDLGIPKEAQQWIGSN